MGVGVVGSPAGIAGEGTTGTLARRTGWILTGIAVLFLAWDMAMKLFLVPMAVDGTTQLGYPAGVIRPLGLVQLGCLVLYLIPRTAPLGAILWTGYLGGAIATHVRLENPLFSHVLFPTYVAALLWGGLWLRDARVRSLMQPEPGRSTNA